MINFDKYAKDLLKYLFEIYAVDEGLVKVNMEIQEILMDINTAIPLGLVLNELILDKLKNNASWIYIDLKMEDDEVFKLSLNSDVDDKNNIELKTPELRFIQSILEQLGGSVDFTDMGEIVIRLKETKI